MVLLRTRDLRANQGDATLLSDTAHASAASHDVGVASHLEIALVTPDINTPRVLDEPVVHILAVDDVSAIANRQNFMIEIIGETRASRVAVDTSALEIVEVRDSRIDGDGDRAKVGNGILEGSLVVGHVDVASNTDTRVTDTLLAVAICSKIKNSDVSVKMHRTMAAITAEKDESKRKELRRHLTALPVAPSIELRD